MDRSEPCNATGPAEPSAALLSDDFDSPGQPRASRWNVFRLGLLRALPGEDGECHGDPAPGTEQLYVEVSNWDVLRMSPRLEIVLTWSADSVTLTASDVAANTFWETDGNTGTTPGTHFVGTTDNQPLDLRVNNTRALRLQPGTGGGPHVVGGASDNACAGGYGGTIGGGGQGNWLRGNHSVIAGGQSNQVDGNLSFVAGHRARCSANGTFVRADSTDADFSATASNQFLVRASGGVGIGTNVTPERLTVAGNVRADSFIGSGASLTGVNADMVDGLHASSFPRFYNRNSYLAAGNVVTLAVPNYAHITLHLSSGHPHSGGMAIIHGFENDSNIGVVYTKYNGDGTSSHGGADFHEMTTSNMVTFGSGANQYTVRCPGEASGDHNIVLTASGLELIYSLSY